MAEQPNAAVNPQQVHYAGQPQYVLMPIRERNGLGVFGFFVALIGFVIPTGLIALLGLLISLVALGKPPRGFAMMGVLIGLLGSAIWLIIDIAAILVGVVAVLGVGAFTAVGFMLTQPEVVEVTGDMINSAIAVEHHHETEGELPDSLDNLGLSAAALADPWGTPYRYELVEREQPEGNSDHRPNFEITSAGPDAAFGTDDDIILSRLDRLWENAFDTFEEKMQQLSAKVETIDRGGRYSGNSGSCMEFSWSGNASCAAKEPEVPDAVESPDVADAPDAPAAETEPTTPAAPEPHTGSFAEAYERKAKEELESGKESGTEEQAEPADQAEAPKPAEPTSEPADEPEPPQPEDEPASSGPV